MKQIATIVVVCSLWTAACDSDEADAQSMLAGQQWEETVSTVDGVPVGETQVGLEMEEGDVSREDAAQRLTVRKRILKDALAEPPDLSDMLRRQSAVHTYLENEIELEEGLRDSVPAATMAEIEDAARREFREPRGFRATIVTVTSDSFGRADLLDMARRARESLGSNPDDDTVQALESAPEAGVVIDVQYAVPFPAVSETTKRFGWQNVSSTGAAEIQSLKGSERRTSVYSPTEDSAQFMVKIAEIPAEEPESATVDDFIDGEVRKLGRGLKVGNRVDTLVKKRPWTVYPDVLEQQMENP